MRQLGGMFSSVMNLLKALRVGRRVPVEHGFGEAQDGGEHVVEIMGDAASEFADGFHFLRLAQLGFQALPLRKIFQCQQRQSFAFGRLDSHATHFHRDRRSRPAPPLANLHLRLTSPDDLIHYAQLFAGIFATQQVG